MTSRVQPDMWTPQHWSHADVLALQDRLDPARMTRYADHWRGVLDDASAVFSRLDADVTRHLAESWRGKAARQALEVLRGYISVALDGLTRCRSLADALVILSDAASELRAAVDGLDHIKDLTAVRVHYSEPAVTAGNTVGEIPGPSAVPGAPVPAFPNFAAPPPVATVPAGGLVAPLGGDTAPWHSSPSPLHRYGFDTDSHFAPTHVTGSSPPSPSSSSPPPPPAPPPPLAGAKPLPEGPLPAATLNAATPPTQPLASAAQGAAGPQPRGGLLPLMGAAHPGVIGRDDGASRRTPGYLITIDNGNKLIGPLPKVAPPVIGEW